MDGLHEVSEVPERALGQSKILTVNQEKLRTTGLESDIKQKKSTGGAHMNQTGSKACYFRYKITKVLSFQNKTENMS